MSGMRTGIEGRLEVAELKERKGLRVLRLTKARVVSEAFGKLVWQASPDEVERPFYVQFDEHGQVRELMIDPRTSLELRGLLDALACGIQAVKPARPKANWSTTETDSSGNYLAEYRALSGFKWQKRKTAYEGSSATNAPAARKKIERSEFQITLDARGDIASVVGQEVVASSAFRGKSELTIALREPSAVNRDSTTSPPDVPSDYAHYAPGAAGRRTQAEQDTQLANGVDIAESTRALSNQGSVGNRAQLRERMAAKVRRDSSAINEVATLVRAADPASRDLISILASAGSPEAQLELVRLADDVRLSDDIRETAAYSLSAVTTPTREFFMAAMRLYQSTKDPALARTIGLNCGGIVRAFKGSSPDVEREFVSAMTHLWRTLPQGRDRENLFVMIANSATSKAVPLLQEVLQKESVAERILALDAMRDMDPSLVVPIARRVMLADDNESVRAAAVAIAKRGEGPELQAALSRVARTDKSQLVRKAAERVASN
jgi:hypothetical protein